MFWHLCDEERFVPSNSHYAPERGCVVSTSRGTSAQIQALGVFVRRG